MKKYFIIAVAAVVALAACTKNNADTTAYEQAKVINFNTVAGKATKAPITGTTYHYNYSSFGVFAWYLAEGNWNTAAANSSAVAYMGTKANSESPLASPVEITWNETKDIWAPNGTTYYWPLQGKLTFIAYSPYNAATATFSNAGVLTLTGYTLNTTVANQVDLLYSAVAADKTQNESYYVDSANSKNSQTAEEDKGVNIQFKHALAQIIFKAKTASDVYSAGLSFKVDNITVNAASTATSMTVTNPAVDAAPAGITTWNTPATKVNFVVRNAAFPEAANTYLTTTLSDPIGDALLAIPVTEFDTTDPTISVTYTLYRLSDNQSLGSKTVTVNVKNVDNVITAWQAGKKYEYDLTIDLQKIYFTPSIIDWTTGEVQGVNIPDGTPYNPAA